MAKILDMPKLSPTMEEGVLSAWHKQEGDAIAVDDVLADVETDKATMEFRAFDKGVLLKVLVAPGTQVKLGQAVAIIGDAGEDISAILAKVGGANAAPAAATPAPNEAKSAAPAAALAPGAAQASAQPAQAPTVAQPVASAPAATGSSQAGTTPLDQGSLLDRTSREATRQSRHVPVGRVLASPYVRKTARDLGVDLTQIRGSGPHGRIEASDLSQAPVAQAATTPATASSATQSSPASSALATIASTGQALARIGLAEPEVRPLSPMRKTIARRLTESKTTVPHFYLTIDVDAQPLSAFRDTVNAELAGDVKGPADKPMKVSFNDILIKACAIALARVPECNASFTEQAILVHKRVDISVAVAIAEGLVTPVVRNADQKSLVAIAREVRELASRARAKKLRPEEMSEGTFSISNLGMFGIDSFSAVINPPEGAILAVGQVRVEPVVKDGQIVVGKKLAMTLSCDHRVVDGAIGASFLAELRALLEKPLRILTG